jgi:hypothetical protein
VETLQHDTTQMTIADLCAAIADGEVDFDIKDDEYELSGLDLHRLHRRGLPGLAAMLGESTRDHSQMGVSA